MNKNIIFIFVFLLFASLVYAQSDPIDLGTYKQNSNINMRVACRNADGDCSNNANCNITVDYPNTNSMIFNQNMTKNNTFYNYTLPDSSTVGRYSMVFKCNDVNKNTTVDYFFFITATGDKSSTLFIFIIELLLKIAFLIFVVILCIWGIRRVRNANENKKTPYVMVAFLRVLWGSGSYAVLFMSPFLALFLFHPNFSIGTVQNLTLNIYWIIMILITIIIILNIFWFTGNILMKFGGLSHDVESTNKVLKDLSGFSADFNSLKNKISNKFFRK